MFDKEDKESVQSKEVVTTKEVARWLHVSAATVRSYAREGLIPCEVTFGGHRRYELPRVLDAWQKVKGAPVAEVEEAELKPIQISEGWKSDWAISAISADENDANEEGEQGDVLQAEPFPGIPGKTRFVVSRSLVGV